MGRMRTAGLGVAHHFAIAVVGSHQQRAACTLDRRGNTAKTGIDGLNRLHSCWEAAGVPDHVGLA